MKINRKHFWCVFFFFPSRIFLRIPQAGLALFALSVKHPGFHSNLVSSPKHTSVKLKGWFLAENTNGSFERTNSYPLLFGPNNKSRNSGAFSGALCSPGNIAHYALNAQHSSKATQLGLSWHLPTAQHPARCMVLLCLRTQCLGRPQPTSVDPNSRNYFNKICVPKTKPFFRAPCQKKQPF